MGFPIIIAIVTATGLGGSEPSPAAGGKGLRFDPPAPCRGTVTETAEKKGKRSTLRYDVVLEPRQGGGWELRIEGVEFREVMGIDLTKEENRKRFAPLLAQMLPLLAAMPRLRLGGDGKVEDVVGTEEAAGSALDVIRKLAGAEGPSGSGALSPKMVETLEKALRSPAMASQMRQKATDFWGIWVGSWLGFDGAPGTEMPAEQEIAFPDGTKVKARGKVRREPDPAEPPGRIALALDSEISGEEARKAFGRMMETVMGTIPLGKDARSFSADQVEEFSRTLKSTVVTDPRTLLPSRAALDSVSTLAIKGQGRKQETERHTYVFEWQGKN